MVAVGPPSHDEMDSGNDVQLLQLLDLGNGSQLKEAIQTQQDISRTELGTDVLSSILGNGKSNG